MTTFVRTAYHQQKMLELEKEITCLRQRVAELEAELNHQTLMLEEERMDRLRLQDRVIELEAQ